MRNRILQYLDWPDIRHTIARDGIAMEVKPMKKQVYLWIAVSTIALLAACTGVSPASAPPAATSVADETTSEPEAASSQTASTDEQSSDDAMKQLIARFDTAPEANGDLLFLFGQVLDVNGNAVPNARIEIWQTDASGVYDHPNDPGTASRDRSFQFFGSTTTDTDGWYAFRTILPGRYEPRPRHIHFKVKQDNETLLTSQFYFSDDVADVEEESMFQAVGEGGDLLLIQLVQGENGVQANGQIVVSTGSGEGTLPLTPSQAEGPYYPTVSPSEYDNDLVRLP